jgi:hypothetical protein
MPFRESPPQAKPLQWSSKLPVDGCKLESKRCENRSRPIACRVPKSPSFLCTRLLAGGGELNSIGFVRTSEHKDGAVEP